jgi:hypothetical protein
VPIQLMNSKIQLTMAALLLALCWSLAAHAGVAQAVTCDLGSTPLYDSSNFAWDPNSKGEIVNAGYDPEGDGLTGASDRPDLFDNASQASFQTGGTSYKVYANPSSNACTFELAGRQLVYPADSTSVTHLSLVRKVYVPPAGAPFGRALDEFTNTGTSPIVFSYIWGSSGNLGSETPPAPNGTVILASSSGDQAVDSGDRWEATAEQDTAATGDARTCNQGGVPTHCDAPVADIWDESAADAAPPRHANSVQPTKLDDDSVITLYSNVTLLPGQTAVFMHVMAPRLTTADAVAAANSLGAGPVDVFTGMTSAECAALQNWVCRQPGPPVTPEAPTAPNTPASGPFGGVALGSHTLKVKNGRVVVTVPCPADAVGNCAGTDTLATAGKVAAPKAIFAAKRKKKVLKLGKGRFSIAPGKRGKVTIKLNRTALKLLKKHRTLRAKQTVVAHDSRNVNRTTTGKLKLTAPKKPKKRR